MENNRYRKNSKGTSIFKGVSWFRYAGKWRAFIKVRGDQKYIGSYDNEEEAARAYDNAAISEFGKFALTNEMLGLYAKDI
jgi:hypothetical protein